MEPALSSASGGMRLALGRIPGTGLATDRHHAAWADLVWEPRAARTETLQRLHQSEAATTHAVEP